MDPTRFDTLTKRLVAPTTRRSALGAAVTGGLLSALGLARAVPEARAAQGGTCVLAFAAQVRQGPSVQQPLTAGSARGGEVRGELSFSLMPSGTLQNATLTLDDGSQLPVVGQANGYALQVRIELEPRVALVAIGVGEQEIARCQGAVDGVAAGPQVGDLGDWHAAGVQQARGSGGSGSGAQAGSGTTARGSSAGTGRGNAGSGNAGSGNAGGQTSPQAQGTGSSAANRDGSCAVGLVRCVCPDPPVDDAVCEGGCTDLNRDNTNCGACNTRCRRDLNEVCLDGVCVVLDDGVDDSCGGGFTLCAGVCVDTLTNGDHCGACNARCNIAAGESCFNGVCGILDVGVLCAVGLFDCAGTCVSFSDETNCGGCGIVCEEGTSCAGGVCCLFGLT
ncbi:MAG: hypothetical protein H0V00_17360, partial [Chloroflexia bacterium]|nr:hypothetical protein [Chloroflexia bacterium]